MRHLNKLFGIAIAVGLTMVVTGCGGSGMFYEGPGEGTGENYVAVEMEVGASGAGYLPSAPDLAKDAGGDAEARIEEGGVGQSEDVMSYVKCEFVNGIVPDGGGETFTPGGIEVVDFANYPGDCDNESACIGCYNRFEIADPEGNPIPDPSESHCIWNCVGIVPEALLENDEAALDLVWKVKLYTNEPSEGINIMRFDYNTPFPTIFETDMSDIASATSDDYDLSLCDETGDVEEMGVSLADDPLTTADPSTFDAFDDNAGAGPIVATKGLDVTGMGNPADGYSDCYIEVQVDGNLLVSVDQSEGTHLFCANYCNDHTSCANFCGGGYFSAGEMASFNLAFATAAGGETPIHNSSAAALNDLGLEFADEAMLVSSVNEATVLIEASNLHADQAEPALFNFAEHPNTLADGADDDEFIFNVVEDKIDLQGLPIVIVVDNVISQAGEIMPYPLVAEATAAWALADNFYIDSNAAYLWDQAITNSPIAIDTAHDTWSEISGAGALTYNVSGNDDYLAYSGDDNLASTSDQFIRAAKLANLDASGALQIEVSISSLAGFDTLGGSLDVADLLQFGVVDSSYSGLVMGVMAYDFAGDATPPYERVVFANNYISGVQTDGAVYDLGAATDVILELTYDKDNRDQYAYAYISGGWIDVENNAASQPFDPNNSQTIGDPSISGDVWYIMEANAEYTGSGSPNVANIDYIRVFGSEVSSNAATEMTEDRAWEGNVGAAGP